MDIQTHAPGYTEAVFNPRKFATLCDRTADAVLLIQRGGLRVNALAGSGNSAAPLLGGVSLLTGIPFILVRKDGDGALDDRRVNGALISGGSYLFIDDLIASGRTFYRVVSRVFEACAAVGLTAMKPSAVLTYDTAMNPSPDNGPGFIHEWICHEKFRLGPITPEAAGSLPTFFVDHLLARHSDDGICSTGSLTSPTHT